MAKCYVFPISREPFAITSPSIINVIVPYVMSISSTLSSYKVKSFSYSPIWLLVFWPLMAMEFFLIFFNDRSFKYLEFWTPIHLDLFYYFLEFWLLNSYDSNQLRQIMQLSPKCDQTCPFFLMCCHRKYWFSQCQY